MIRIVLRSLLALGLLLLALSFAGALHAAGDALAVFRLQIALGCLIAATALAFMQDRAGWLGAIAALAAMLPVLWAVNGPQDDPGAVTMYQKNMRFRPRDLGPLIDDISATNPDVLTLQEVTPENAELLAAIKDAMPTQLICPFVGVGAVALATRWPLIAGSAICNKGQGLAALQAIGPQGPVWLVSVHLHWPWPNGQASQLDHLMPVLQALDGPVLIGGDFNMVPWSYTLERVIDATDTERIGRAFNSLPRFSPLAPLAIDHILVPSGTTGRTERRPLLGSDHFGILARMSL